MNTSRTTSTGKTSRRLEGTPGRDKGARHRSGPSTSGVDLEADERTKATLDTARASVAAVFDDRLEKIDETARSCSPSIASLQKVDEQLRRSRCNVKEQVQKELARPINAAAESCRKLDDQLMRSLLQRLDHKVGRTQRALNIALFAAGFTGGGLIVACLFHLLSSHWSPSPLPWPLSDSITRYGRSC